MIKLCHQWHCTYEILLNSFDIGTPYITDCVMGELEKLGLKYRLALK